MCACEHTARCRRCRHDDQVAYLIDTGAPTDRERDECAAEIAEQQYGREETAA
ncbi:hypothetical protein UFOVP1186_5 [uncultured Caudovirales phage]|uniref:Uncharacterized protein n=1 Tax=uncultured Caudovirales phage TaxID=2100421 RepID=A0A6J5R6U6_9CAUD|nr:hypothetical protein UFOVP959_19 [uncultured Caudovirales phage]CAB4189261.1 hypothetical protein UFOVP1186_5 [uncultured Caudovirales phage]CAB4192263.1 hypothetical protein UFOVP1234_14 [uncultured Caudovirales phage]CAB4215564.1 hypothetical protein UFOVP1487_27 [uncultured Caudovirales phage]CAB5238935.1 hypothetical protein UFOVP1574_27 [uncultured Caudovirales phage]